MKLADLNETMIVEKGMVYPDQRSEAKIVLAKAGYGRIGQGSFADVYHKPGQKSVLKLFDNDDVAYLDYIAFCRKNKGNPHFPKFSQNVIEVNEKYSLIRTELLKNMWDVFDVEECVRINIFVTACMMVKSCRRGLSTRKTPRIKQSVSIQRIRCSI
jgi:hypothetical protein